MAVGVAPHPPTQSSPPRPTELSSCGRWGTGVREGPRRPSGPTGGPTGHGPAGLLQTLGPPFRLISPFPSAVSWCLRLLLPPGAGRGPAKVPTQGPHGTQSVWGSGRTEHSSAACVVTSQPCDLGKSPNLSVPP